TDAAIRDRAASCILPALSKPLKIQPFPMQERYEPAATERAAQNFWDQNRVFEARENDGEKFYCLSMFPYPSGRLHMGHVRNYTIGDVLARLKRMQGFNVLHPIGYDSFGLPAENAAIKNKTSPRAWTDKHMDVMNAQMKQLGLSYSWERFLFSHSENYYRWNQW